MRLLKIRESVPTMPLQAINEAPEVIGMISTILENGGSLDKAIRYVASDGPHFTSIMFREIVFDADTRIEPDILSSLNRRISSMPENLGSYAMALRMIISASGSSDSQERTRVLKDASELALDGLRDAGKGFTSSLNTPCMMIFGAGVLLPMVLMSILPMMSVSGLFGSSAFDTRAITILTLVILPAGSLSVAIAVNSRNPLKSGKNGINLEYALPPTLAIPVFFGSTFLTNELWVRICISSAVSSLAALILLTPGSNSEKKRTKVRDTIEESIIEIGNRLLSGSSFENAIIDTLSSRKNCMDVAKRFGYETALCRGDMKNAITSVFSEYGEDVTEHILSIYQTSEKNTYESGKLAIALGKQILSKRTVRKTIRNEMKNMTDTLFGTASVFAPMVLGLSVSMMKPMSKISSAVDIYATAGILSAYLCELCAVISLLMTFIEGKNDSRAAVLRFAVMNIMSVTVFTAAMKFSM